MPAYMVRFLQTVISLGCLAAFAYCFVRVISDTLEASETAPSYSATFVYIATGLSGLVGGVTAAAFGQPLPKPPAVGGSLMTPMRSWLETSSQKVVPTLHVDARIIVASLYGIVYVVSGFAAIIIWASKSDIAPDVLKNFAAVAFGLFSATALAFVSGSSGGPPPPPPPPAAPA